MVYKFTRGYFIWTKETGERELVKSADLITQSQIKGDLSLATNTLLHIEKADQTYQWINVRQLEYLGMFSASEAPTKI